MRSFVLTLAGAAVVAAPALSAQSLAFADWGFLVTFPGESNQRISELRDRSILLVASPDNTYAITVARYRAPITDPSGMLDFMTGPDTGQTVVSSQPLTLPGAVGREVVLKRTSSSIDMSSGFELRRVFVRGNIVYRVTALYPDEGAAAPARAFATSFTLQ